MFEAVEDLHGLELAEQIFTDVKFYVSGQVSEKALELLKSGGAERMNYFSDYVTHLICGQDCEETDLSDATEIYEIPALVEKWIVLCARLKCLVNTKPFIYNPNKLFAGLVFCFSRIGRDREVLWAVITYYGGVVHMKLTRAVTHLVTFQTESDKYRRAASYPDKIDVVSPDWVFESVRNKALAQTCLFHPKLIDYPVVVKRPDTTAITGFEPECGEKEEEASSTADSTQALLDKLKQRMPWNQPSEPPPNVVAPSFTGQKPPQEQRMFTPNVSQPSQFNPVLGSPNQAPRSIVHHTPQPNQQQQFVPSNFPNNNPNFNKILEQLQRPNVQTINRIGQHNFIQKPQQMVNMQGQPGIVQRQVIKQLPGGQQIIQQPNQQQLVNRQIIGNQQMLQGQKMQQIGQRILVGQQQNIALQKQQQQLGLEQQIVSSVQNQQPNQNIIHQSGGGQIVQQHMNQPPVQQQQIVQNQLLNQQQQPQQIIQNQQQQQQLVQSPQHQQQIIPNQPPQQILQNQQSQQIIQNQQLQNPQQQIIQNQPQQIVPNQHQQQQQQQMQNQMITQQIQSPQHQQLQSPQRQQLQSPQHLNMLMHNLGSQQQQQQQPNVLNHQHINSQQNLLNVLQQQQQQNQHLISQQQNIVQVQQQQNVVIQQQQNVVIQQQNIISQQPNILQQQQPNMLQQQQPNILQQQQQQPNILQQQQPNILQQQQQPNILQQQQQQPNIMQQQTNNIMQQQNIVQQQQGIVQQNIHQQTIITQQQQNLLNQQNQNILNQQGNVGGTQQQQQQPNILNINQQQQMGGNQNQPFNNVNIPPNKVIQNQFGQQVIVQNQQQIMSSGQQNAQQQQQFVNAGNNQNYQQTQFIANQNQYSGGGQQVQQPGQQQMPQLVQAQQNQFAQQNQQQQQGGNLQIINQQQVVGQQQLQQQKQPPPQQHLMGGQASGQFQGGQNPQQRPALWQQIRHPNGVNIVQQQGARVQWSGGLNQQQQPVQRQFIHLDAQTHQQLQQMAPEERALFVQKLQKHRLILQRQQILQQQRSGHILIRSNGPVPQGLTPQQHVQWLQQQAKQQIVLQQQQQNVQAPQPQAPPTPAPTPTPVQQHTPGLSPIQQPQPVQQQPPFNEQNLQQQRQQLRLHQLQLQREQAQKGVQGLPGQQVAPGQMPVRPQGIDPATGAVLDGQQSPLVNAKTKTALANMLSIRLQSGSTAIGPGGEAIPEPSAAGTLRMMTQRNAALNSSNRQDILALQQQQSRVINPPSVDAIRPPTPAQVQQNQPPDQLPKPQYSPRSVLPIQHRPGTFYGHNPNLKLPPDLFLLGCIFVVVELERFLDESMPGWQKKIEKYGGEIEKQYCTRVTHVLCETQRHGVVMQALRDCKRCVTLYWLSDVMNRKQVLPPWTALHLPTMNLDSVPASKHLISLTGFSGTERERVKHMIKYIGASLTTYFSKHNTLLIATKPEGSKFNHAKRWGVPAVNIQWLTEVMLGNFSALNQLENVKYQQFNTPVNFSFDPALVPNLMHAWKMPINISQESYKRVKRSTSPGGAMPQKVKKMKVEHVTDENENVENLPRSGTHRILFSRCADIKELKEMVLQLGGSVVKHPSEATHLVLSQLLRTTKLLHSVCLGAKIVSEYWLRDSANTKTFLDENNYTLDTKDFNSKYKCDFAQTLTLKNRSKLLEGKFFFITPSVFPSKKTVTEIVQASGGVVERTRRTISQIEATNVNSPYSYIILTHEKDLHLVADLLKNKKDKIRIVCNVELILSAVLRQTFDVEPYVVKVV